MPNKENPEIYLVEPRGEGGMIHYAYQLATGFAENQANITLITSKNYELSSLPHSFKVNKLLNLWSTTSPTLNYENKLGLAFHTIFRKIRRAFRGIKYILQWIKLTLFLAYKKPDIIIFGKIEFPIEGFFLKWLQKRGLILVNICHEFELREQTNSPLTNWLNKQYHSAFETFSMLFFHAKDNLDRFYNLFSIDKEKLKLIDHGNEDIFILFDSLGKQEESDFHDRYTIKKGQNVLLFFGLLSPSKGIPVLIDAFAKVIKTSPNTRLIIAGGQSKYINVLDLFTQAESLGIRDQIIFDIRYIPNQDVKNLMDIATIVIYPYLSSTQSGALQVAYTFGKPIIASNIGGLPEVVEDGKSGILVSPDDPSSLATAISTLLDDPEKLKFMGSRGKELSQTRFSWKKIGKEILSELRDSRSN